MLYGPLLNINIKKQSSRDSLGTDNIATSFQRELCPIINTVTHRPFYWCFFVWNLYEFHQIYPKVKDKTYDNFYKFLRRNDYFFVLSNIICGNEDKINMPGKTRILDDYNKNKSGYYSNNDNYYSVKIGGMQYYDAGCYTMNLITTKDNNNNEIKYGEAPYIVNPHGVELANIFGNIIKRTEYYQNEYYKNDKPVPLSVLQELGSVLKININDKEELRKKMYDLLFNIEINDSQKEKTLIEIKKQLIKTRDFAYYLYHEQKMKEFPNSNTLRKLFFDVYSPMSPEYIKPNERYIKSLANWEFVVGRQYFAMGINLIWKYMLFQLSYPKTLEEWLNDSINESNIPFIKANLSEIISSCNFSFDDRENMIVTGSGVSRKDSNTIENGLKIILSIYNRFYNRKDINPSYYNIGDNISMNNLIKLVNEYKEKPVNDFLTYLMINWIIKQHHYTALNKIKRIDGYCYSYNDGKYTLKNDIEPRFQALRITNIIQIMDDLGVL